MLRIGSRTLLCARDIVAEAAIRGQQQLVTQLQKYALSLLKLFPQPFFYLLKIRLDHIVCRTLAQRENVK